MKLYIVLIAMLMAVMMLSCNRNNTNEDSNKALKDIETEGYSMNKEIDKPGDLSATDTSLTTGELPGQILQSDNPVSSTDWDKKIIKTAEITIELKDYKNFNNKIHRNVAGFGAYIAAEEQNESDERITNSVSIKVPVDKFQELVNSLSSDDIKITAKKITTDDVTRDVVDTKSRIEAKKQVRAQYMELLKQAKNMQEILQVQTEINSIQEGLESASGRVNYLVHQSAYSTVHLTYYQYLKDFPLKDLEPTFFSKLMESFRMGSAMISGFVLVIAAIWPLLFAVIIGLFFIKKWKLHSLKRAK